MAYEKHTWVCGETITADKMNHIEDGIAEGGGGASGITLEVVETRRATAEELEVAGCPGSGETTVYNCTGADLFNAITSGVCVSKVTRTQSSGYNLVTRNLAIEAIASDAGEFGYNFYLVFYSETEGGYDAAEYHSIGENSPVVFIGCTSQ